MEYNSLKELYRALIPAFNVKKRLISNSIYKDIRNEDIWKYLAENIWPYDINLTIGDIVNDIINVDIELVNEFKQGGIRNEKR